MENLKRSNETKKLNGKRNINRRNRSFFLHYFELCRAKNFSPIPEVKALRNQPNNYLNNVPLNVLDFFGDKLKADDWMLLIEAINSDQTLDTIAIRLRKYQGHINERVDSEKKTKTFKNRPTIYSKFIFDGLIDAISNCINLNENLKILCLEALPLNEKYIVSIAKAISCNSSLKSISVSKSNIGDKGCEHICSTIKYLINIETINMAQCNLTSKGAGYIADMIRFQKIFRYSEGWKKSLRYRDVNADKMPGLRHIIISDNPSLDDKGVKYISEVLKEDDWIKSMYIYIFFVT